MVSIIHGGKIPHYVLFLDQPEEPALAPGTLALPLQITCPERSVHFTGGMPTRTLEIDEDLKAQRRLWKIQDYGRALIAIFLFTAALGLFGDGPLTRGVHRINGVEFRFDRFATRSNEHEIEVFPTQKIWISEESLKGMKLERIMPEPSGQTWVESGLTLSFDEPTRVRIFLKPSTPGRHPIRVRADESALLQMTQFVWP